LLCEFDGKAWANAVSWSPNGFRIAYAGHDSTLTFAQILAGSNPIIQTVNLKGLPFLDVRFLSDNTLVAVGYDNAPFLFTVQGGSDADPKWGFLQTCDTEDKKSTTPTPTTTAPKVGSSFKDASKLFQDSASKGIGPASGTQKKKKHQHHLHQKRIQDIQMQ